MEGIRSTSPETVGPLLQWENFIIQTLLNFLRPNFKMHFVSEKKDLVWKLAVQYSEP